MHPLVRSLLTRATRAVHATGATRAGERVLRGPAVAAVALALLALGPRLAAAQATAEGKACVELVDEFAATCDGYSWYVEYPCLWLAGVGYMACVLVDLIVLLGKSVTLPSPI